MANTKKRTSNIFPLATRPALPDDLTGDAAELWRQVVDSLPADYLRPADLPLLRAYCVARDRWQTAERILQRDGLVVEGRPHPALQISDQQAKLMMSLAGKLRLCPSSRIRADSADLRRAHEGPLGEAKGVTRFFT